VSLPGRSGTIPYLAIRTKETPMTSIRTYDPSNGAALPELPPLCIRELVVGTLNLLQEAADLPQPRCITVSAIQHIDVQFSPDPASLKAVTRWALKFGGVIISESHDGQRGPETYCHTELDYFGVAVDVYAFVPAKKATT
jgi:hypothetical protein